MMKNFSLGRGLKSAMLLTSLLLPSIAGAQYFTDTEQGDVNAGFRKTGANQEQYEMVVYLGNVSNFMAQAAGTTVTLTNYNSTQLSTMCPDGYGNLQWSVFAQFEGNLTNYWGNYSGLPAVVWPRYTCWYTLARTNVNVQTTPVGRLVYGAGDTLQSVMLDVPLGAQNISQQLAQSSGTNSDNNTGVLLEPIDFDSYDDLSAAIGDKNNNALGDFGGGAIDYSVENITPNSFTSAVVSDFYVNVSLPSSLSKGIDPLTGLTSGNADYLGYFTLNPSGVMTFTRASAVSAPSVSSVTASATNGFGPLTVVFSDSTSGSATNWVWNFGNGTIVTNTTAGNVTNIYSAAGTYTVTLTVYGPGGSSTDTIANFIVASPKPKISFAVSGANLVFSGVNCPAGVQYRILSTTNILTAPANWKPVYTNTFANSGTFSYTNGIGTGNSFFILVSP